MFKLYVVTLFVSNLLLILRHHLLYIRVRCSKTNNGDVRCIFQTTCISTLPGVQPATKWTRNKHFCILLPTCIFSLLSSVYCEWKFESQAFVKTLFRGLQISCLFGFGTELKQFFTACRTNIQQFINKTKILVRHPSPSSILKFYWQECVVVLENQIMLYGRPGT